MNGVFFVSDTHWGHSNVIGYSNRPFSTVEEMDEALIENWNATVKRGDRVYHLGDLSFHTPENTDRILNRLNGQIYLIRGNHDKDHLLKKLKYRFVWVKDLYDLDVGKQRIVLCHYSMRVWNKSHRGAFQLYGHSHGSLYDDARLRSMDVGVDSTHGGKRKYFPISLEEVTAHMQTKTWDPVDHHIGMD